MLFVVFGVLTITVITLTNRKAVHTSKTLWGVLATNYMTALSLSLALGIVNGLGLVSSFTWILGFATGLLYAGSLFLNMKIIGRRGASIAISVSQLSVLVPVVLSVALFSETLRANQLVGVVLALVSLPLLATKTGAEASGSMDRGTMMLLVGALLVQGFGQFSSKVLVASGLGAQTGAFFIAVFASATLFTVPVALRHWKNVEMNDLFYGAVVGVSNIGGNLSILLALVALPGAIVFPMVSSGGLLLITILAWFIFKERVGRQNAIGMMLTLSAVLLINV
jgi:drug/metabolite transporter (DMT)-like permease